MPQQDAKVSGRNQTVLYVERLSHPFIMSQKQVIISPPDLSSCEAGTLNYFDSAAVTDKCSSDLKPDLSSENLLIQKLQKTHPVHQMKIVSVAVLSDTNQESQSGEFSILEGRVPVIKLFSSQFFISYRNSYFMGESV